jgi:hypothetical protein
MVTQNTFERKYSNSISFGTLADILNLAGDNQLCDEQLAEFLVTTLTETDFTKDSAFSFEALKIIDLLKPALSIELYENLTAVMSPIYLLGRMNQIYVEVYSRVLQGICSREHFSHGFPSLIILTILEMINRNEKDQVVLNCLSTLRFSFIKRPIIH